MKTWIALGLCLSVVVAGCASEKAEIKEDRLTVGKVQGEIKVGMPASQVAELLGSPNIVTTDDKRREVWIYDKVSTDRVDTASSSYAGLIILGDQIERQLKLDSGSGRSPSSSSMTRRRRSATLPTTPRSSSKSCSPGLRRALLAGVCLVPSERSPAAAAYAAGRILPAHPGERQKSGDADALLRDPERERNCLSASAAVLQDLGFQVEESVREVGFLRATKERSAREYGQEIRRGLFAFCLVGETASCPVDLHQKIAASLVARPLKRRPHETGGPDHLLSDRLERGWPS